MNSQENLEFTQDQLLNLSPTCQYKKLADLLKQIILYETPDWKTQIRIYNQWLEWITHSPNYRLQDKSVQLNQLVEMYQYWRNQAGLVPEGDLFNHYTFTDLPESRTEPLPWSVLVHNLRSAFNVGSIFRTCDCCGWKSVELSGFSAGPEHKNVKSTANGAEDWIKSNRWNSPFECIANLEPGTAIVALETNPSAQSLHEFKWPQTGLLVLGNEEFGIPPNLMEKVTHTVQIPMFGRKASLNVANAFAITAYQVRNYWNTKTHESRSK